MLEFFKKLFAPERSSETAKERLRLVLLSDHLSLAPDTIQALKRDLLEVISRYVDIDAGNADVTFEHREHEVAMLASIPITGVRERTPSPPMTAAVAPSAVTAIEAQADPPRAQADVGEAPSLQARAEAAEPVEASVTTLPVRSGHAGRP